MCLCVYMYAYTRYKVVRAYVCVCIYKIQGCEVANFGNCPRVPECESIQMQTKNITPTLLLYMHS